jgi:plastocyanin
MTKTPKIRGSQDRLLILRSFIQPGIVILLIIVFFAGFTGLFVANLVAGFWSQDGSGTPAVSLVKIPSGGTFTPEEITVVIGVNNTVTWTNDDLIMHTVTSDSGLFDSGNLKTGASWSFTFNQPGTYSYHCSIHPWMLGVVNVVK